MKRVTEQWLENVGFKKVSMGKGEGHYHQMKLSDEKYCDLAFVTGDKYGVLEVTLFPYDNFRYGLQQEVRDLYKAITGKELVAKPK